MPEPAPHILAAFAPLPTVRVGQDLTREHAVCLDAHRHACGLPPWLDGSAGSVAAPTAAEINGAVIWWNTWHGTRKDDADD